MRLDLPEIAVSECSEVEPREKRHHYEYREEYLQLGQQLLPEDARVSEVIEPHPVRDEADHHKQEADDDGYQHDDYGQTLARVSAFTLEFDLIVSVDVFLFAECQCSSPPFRLVTNTTD